MDLLEEMLQSDDNLEKVGRYLADQILNKTIDHNGIIDKAKK